MVFFFPLYAEDAQAVFASGVHGDILGEYMLLHGLRYAKPLMRNHLQKIIDSSAWSLNAESSRELAGITDAMLCALTESSITIPGYAVICVWKGVCCDTRGLRMVTQH